jgi:AhpD family alkylhydroperoxidase
MEIAMKLSVVALSVVLSGLGAVQVAQADAAADTLAEIRQTLGFVPSFVQAVPAAALPGAWIEVRDLMYSDSALDMKTKALISLGVSAQIPCEYCIIDDTASARRAGATDEEIKEAVAVAALTRHWSTIFNGNQVDLTTFKAEMAGN